MARSKTMQAAVTKVRSLIKGLAKNADSIAVQLYREKVRGAKCGDIDKCALAQYFANAMPKGITIAVDGSGVSIFDTTNQIENEWGSREPDEEYIELSARACDFISAFDNKQYGFLSTTASPRR